MHGRQGTLRTFMSTAQGPGKLAPALIEDLRLYDPRRPLPNGLNVLRDTPVFYSGYKNIAALLPVDSCHHVWCAKDRQGLLPAIDTRPESDSVYKFAGVCRKCRTHLELKVDYTVRWASAPCPNQTYPLHHFVHSPWRETVARNDGLLQNIPTKADILAFECSSPTCSATVSVRLRPPVLSDEHILSLTDRKLLSQRAEEVLAAEPARFEGHSKPTPVDVLSDLKSYLKDSFEHQETKPIKTSNKRFALKFGKDGQPCKEVLEFIGFSYESQEHWLLPQPKPEDSPPFQDPFTIFLDDVTWEVNILISLLPENERRQIHDNPNLPDASRDLLRIFGAQGYDKITAARTTVSDPATRPIQYSALGTPQDASDELVRFAYRQQTHVNAKEAPTYLTYLHEISTERRSELLQTTVATEYSEGHFDSQQLDEAYRYFALSPRDDGTTDDLILGTFNARLQDSARHEADMRGHLKIIGMHRNSQRIKDVAEAALDTYEQALAFFDAEASLTDEFFPSLYTTKTSEDSALQEKARKAIKLIADARCSAALQSWLSTGEFGESAMDISEAYRLFGIDDRTIDATMIESAYRVAMEDNPGQTETYTKAFNAIVADRQSSHLQATSRCGQSRTDLCLPNWPVGLENIGNTCYLNSLLQFLFTIPKLRNLVLNFDDVKMELTPENVAQKRVGSRQITLREVQRAQRFVLKLKDLFEEMITSPYKYVAPEQELTRLTLMTSTAAENIRRRSTIGGSRPLGTINGLAVQGPSGPPTDVEKEASQDHCNDPYNDQPMLSPLEGDGRPGQQNQQSARNEAGGSSESVPLLASPNLEMDAPGDNSSEATLVSIPSIEDSIMVDDLSQTDQHQVSKDKENLPPLKAATSNLVGDSETTATRVILPADPSPSGMTVESGTQVADLAGAMDTTGETISIEPPNRPPPIPPRPLASSQEDHTLEEYARQQDVTEVLNHVLFQLSCAIKPLSFDAEGEQNDQIKELFYGRTKQHIMSNDKDEAKNDRFCSIIVRLFSLPDDIYAALDGYFDVEEIANKKRFLSISELPPIFQIQIDRAGLDQKKNNHHVELKETIYLDRYLEADTNPALLHRRQEAWQWKKELADVDARLVELSASTTSEDAQTTFQDARAALMHLQELSHLHLHNTTTTTAASASASASASAAASSSTVIDIPPSLIPTLESLTEHTQHEVSQLTTRRRDLAANINSQVTDNPFRTQAYRLHAAFFHHGTASSGHYWIYIYDFEREMWLKYNDTRVELVADTNEIFRRPGPEELAQWNGPSNPYYLVYVRDEGRVGLVQSVWRFPRGLDREGEGEGEGFGVMVGDDVGMDGDGDGGGGGGGGGVVGLGGDVSGGGGGDWANIPVDAPSSSLPTLLQHQSQQSASGGPLAVRDRYASNGEWDNSEATVAAKW